jgi:uncharacterized membrane protein required for colicin V production
MKRRSLIVIAALLLFSSAAFGQEVYRWVDEQGTVHFTDDLGQVPEKYRDKIQKKEPPKGPPITRQGWRLRRDLGQPLDKKIS